MQLPENRNAVVLMIDGLGANMLGSYGSTWLETENFNRLAARALLFDHCFSPTSELQRFYEAIIGQTGQGDLAIDVPQHEALLPDNALNCFPQNCHSVLLTDEPLLMGRENSTRSATQAAVSDCFDEVIWVGDEESSSKGVGEHKLAPSIEQTRMARFFAEAIERISELEANTIVWLHARGLSGPWDAPYTYRQHLAHPDDPDPPHFSDVPETYFDTEQGDPDELLGVQQACAAQVAMIDDFVGVILGLMETDSAWDGTLFCCSAPRGFPLGEHGLVGQQPLVASGVGGSQQAVDDAVAELKLEGASQVGSPVETAWAMPLFNEMLHVPLLVCLPRGSVFADERAIRSGQLIQPSWIANLLRYWLDHQERLPGSEGDNRFTEFWQAVSQSLPTGRTECVISTSDSAVAVQTHAWKFIRRFDDEGFAPSADLLFVKPDDRWEVNDVSRRCRQVVEAFETAVLTWVGSTEATCAEKADAGEATSGSRDSTGSPGRAPTLTTAAVHRALESGTSLVLPEHLSLPMN